MSFVASLELAGFLPLRDHNPATADAQGLSVRNVRYAGTIIERDQYSRWLWEEDSVGDVNCATLLAVDSGKRSIPGWAYAWPMLTSPDSAAVTTPGFGGFVTIQGGTQDAILANASLAKPGVQPGAGGSVGNIGGGTTKKTFGTVGRPGFSGGHGVGGGDFSSAGPTPRERGRPAPGGIWGIGGGDFSSIGGGGLGNFPNYGGDFSWSRSGGSTLDKSDAQARANLGGGGNGPRGPAGGVGSAGTAFQRPDVKVRVRPIFGDDFQADGRFLMRTVEMDGSFPDFHKGALGITISGVKERAQDPLYFPTDPRLIAVEYGSRASAASMVCDLNGDAMVDPLRTARLHSLCRVIKGPGGGAISFGDNILALNYSRAGRDGVPGYGAVIDQGEASVAATPITLVARNLNTGETGVAAQATHSDRTMNPKFGGQVVGLMSWAQASGPISMGASKGDKHQFGVDADGHPTSSAHLSCDAYFKMPNDDDLDAPLDFSPQDYPKVHHPSYNLATSLVYDGKMQHAWRGGPKKGMWRWFTYGYIGSGGGTPTTPPTGNPRPPPPTTPGVPVPPRQPPVITPPSAPLGGGGIQPGFAGAQFRTGLGSIEDASWYVGRRLPEPPAPVDISTFAPPSNTISRPWEREDKADRESRTHLQLALPAILGRALSLNRAHASARGALDWTTAQAAAWHGSAPTVARIEAFGAQWASGAWNYTQRPSSRGRFEGGTSNGGWLMLPPETSLEDAEASFARTTIPRSTSYFVAGPGTYFAAGLPITTSGGVKSGYRWGLSSADLVFQHLDSSGASTTVAKMDSSKAFSFRETGDPVLLTVGAVADGSLLRRVTGTVVGATLKDVNAAEILERITTHNDITNTNVETDLYGKSLLAGTLGTDRAVRLTIDGDVLQNNTQTFILKVKYGATTLYDSGATTLANNANRHAFRMQVDLYADGATNAQDCGGWVSLGSTTAATTGTSAISSTGINPAVICGAGSAEDSTLAKFLRVTITWSGTSASVSFRLKHATLERL